MSTPHKHAAVIKAWADGAAIECRPPAPSVCHNQWITVLAVAPEWLTDWEYRVKPHQWQEVIDAHAAGKAVQFKHADSPVTGPWYEAHKNVATTSYDAPNLMWRIKPATVRFRLALVLNAAYTGGFKVAAVHNSDHAKQVERIVGGIGGFVRWLGDWQEVEA